MLSALARQLVQTSRQQLPSLRRRLAGKAGHDHGHGHDAVGHGQHEHIPEYVPFIPRHGNHWDHVYGCDEYRLKFDFEPPSATRTFVQNILTFGVWFIPIWVFLWEDWRYTSFEAKLAAARAARDAKKAKEAAALLAAAE